MDILERSFIKGFIQLAEDGWRKGWHERNGGNLSYRIKSEEINDLIGTLNMNNEWTEIGTKVEALANEYFLITASGSYFKNIKQMPSINTGIIQINDGGTHFRIVWGFDNDGRPTSELPTHLMNHCVKKRVSNGEHRVIYHAHTTNLISLTFIVPLDYIGFTRMLWGMATECPIVFPTGVGIVEWMVPGGKQIAEASANLMEKHDIVVWAHHGTFCSGVDFDTTFGLMDTVEKAAEILIKVKSTGCQIVNGITAGDFRNLAKSFNIVLAEEYLQD